MVWPSDLPTELYAEIFKYLPARDAWRLRTVCKGWNQNLSTSSAEAQAVKHSFLDVSDSAKQKLNALSIQQNFQVVKNHVSGRPTWHHTIDLETRDDLRFNCGTVRLHGDLVLFVAEQVDYTELQVIDLIKNDHWKLKIDNSEDLYTSFITNDVAGIVISEDLYIWRFRTDNDFCMHKESFKAGILSADGDKVAGLLEDGDKICGIWSMDLVNFVEKSASINYTVSDDSRPIQERSPQMSVYGQILEGDIVTIFHMIEYVEGKPTLFSTRYNLDGQIMVEAKEWTVSVYHERGEGHYLHGPVWFDVVRDEHDRYQLYKRDAFMRLEVDLARNDKQVKPSLQHLKWRDRSYFLFPNHIACWSDGEGIDCDISWPDELDVFNAAVNDRFMVVLEAHKNETFLHVLHFQGESFKEKRILGGDWIWTERSYDRDELATLEEAFEDWSDVREDVSDFLDGVMFADAAWRDEWDDDEQESDASSVEA